MTPRQAVSEAVNNVYWRLITQAASIVLTIMVAIGGFFATRYMDNLYESNERVTAQAGVTAGVLNVTNTRVDTLFDRLDNTYTRMEAARDLQRIDQKNADQDKLIDRNENRVNDLIRRSELRP